jgi:hypothetical protein
VELLVDISQIAGSLALVITVIILLRELRENNRLARAANTQALVSISTPFHLAMIQDRSIAELYLMPSKQLAERDEVDRWRHRALVIWWLIFHENVYYQWRQNLLDTRIFEPWARDLKSFVVSQELHVLWPDISKLFQSEFAAYVAEIMQTTSVPIART